MDYYKDLAEMYVGDDVSPDFYGWVFPKYDHVAVGTGTVVNKTAIKQYQQATRDRSKVGLLCPAALAWCAGTPLVYPGSPTIHAYRRRLFFFSCYSWHVVQLTTLKQLGLIHVCHCLCSCCT